jgi:hypothetical protein
LDFLHGRGFFVFHRTPRKLNVKNPLKIVLVPHIGFLNPFLLVLVITGVKNICAHKRDYSIMQSTSNLKLTKSGCKFLHLNRQPILKMSSIGSEK